MKSSWTRSFLLSLVLLVVLAPPVLAGGDDPPARQRDRELRGGFPVKVYSGEAVVRVDDSNYVIIALDEPNAKGITDGFADHVFSLVVRQPVLEPLSLRDAAAEVEFRPQSVRVLLHSEERELEFVLADAQPSPKPRRSIYRIQSFQGGLAFYELSGAAAERISLDEVQRKGLQALGDFNPKTEPFYQPPNPGSGGNGCAPSCSTVCPTGACAASCHAGSCAKCYCAAGDTAPNCYCV